MLLKMLKKISKNKPIIHLKNKFKDEHFQEDCFHLLEMMISNSSFYFEKLPLIENVELLRNIIYSGIWTKFELIKKKRMEEKS